MHVLHKKFMYALIAFVCTEIKLKSIKPTYCIYHWIRPFMESKKVFILCLHSKGYVSYGHLRIYNAVKSTFTVVIS